VSDTTGSGELVSKPVPESSDIQPVVYLDDRDIFEEGPPRLTPAEQEFLACLMRGSTYA